MSKKVTVLRSTLPPAFLKRMLSGEIKFTSGKVVTISVPDDEKTVVYPKGPPRPRARA